MSEKVTFDTAISTAFLQLQQQALSVIPDLSLLSATFSPSPTLAKKLNVIIRTAEKKQNRTVRFKYIARTAAAIIIVFTLLSAHPTVATAMKKIFSQTVVQWFDKYISIETQADTYPQQITDFTVGYMTDGFVLKEEYKIDDGVKKVYYYDNLFLEIKVIPDDGSNITGYDIENSTIDNIYLKNNTGTIIIHNSGFNALVISVDGVQYSINGYVQVDEIIKIFKNIEISL